MLLGYAEPCLCADMFLLEVLLLLLGSLDLCPLLVDQSLEEITLGREGRNGTFTLLLGVEREWGQGGCQGITRLASGADHSDIAFGRRWLARGRSGVGAFGSQYGGLWVRDLGGHFRRERRVKDNACAGLSSLAR